MKGLGITNLPEKWVVSKIWQRCQVKIQTIDEHTSMGLHNEFQERVTFLFIFPSILPSGFLNRILSSFSNDNFLVILILAFFPATKWSGWEQTSWLSDQPVPVIVPDNSIYRGSVDSISVQ